MSITDSLVIKSDESYGSIESRSPWMSKSERAKSVTRGGGGLSDSFKEGRSLPSSMSFGQRYVIRKLDNIPRISVNRSVMDQQNLELWTADGSFVIDQVKKKKNCGFCEEWWDNFSFKRFCQARVPTLEWLPRYDYRTNLLSDLVAGLTLAVMQVPQGMAYAMLANVPPVIGLYTSFFPGLVYFLLGTSRHGSIGTFALISMMTNTAMEDVLGQLREDKVAQLYPNGTGALPSGSETNSTSRDQPLPIPDDDDLGIDTTQIAVVVAFLVGIFQVVMGMARMGYLTVLMSDKMISGLITGTAVQVLTSQLKAITGVSIVKFSGIFNTIYTWLSFFTKFQTIKWAVCLVSGLSLAFLLLVKFLVDPSFKKKTNVPFPSELLLIVFVTFFSYYLNFNEKFDMEIIGDIPTGLVAPKIPTFSFIPNLLTGSAMVTIVGVSLSLSIVLSYGKKHNYSVDSNQELLAYGSANIVGSFFSCIPCSISLSRSAVLDSSGAKTQLATLVSCVILLVVILVMGPLFSALPDAVLSVIIVVALRSMLAGFADLIPAWKASKAEALVWMTTFLGVIVLDIDYGLGIGVFVSLSCFLLDAHRPGEIFILGRLPDTEIYLNAEKYNDTVREVDGVKIYGVPGPIYFGNREFFKSEILKGVDHVEYGISHVIISFAAVSFIDSGGVEAMKTLNKDLEERGVIMYLAAPTDSVLNVMQKCDYFPDLSSKSVIFPTIHDAVTRALHKDSTNNDPKPSTEDRQI